MLVLHLWQCRGDIALELTDAKKNIYELVMRNWNSILLPEVGQRVYTRNILDSPVIRDLDDFDYFDSDRDEDSLF